MPKEALQGCFINKHRSAGKKVTISDMEIAQIKKPPREAVNNQILLTINLLLNIMESEKRVPMSPTGARCGNSPLHYGGGYFCYGNICKTI